MQHLPNTEAPLQATSSKQSVLGACGWYSASTTGTCSVHNRVPPRRRLDHECWLGCVSTQLLHPGHRRGTAKTWRWCTQHATGSASAPNSVPSGHLTKLLASKRWQHKNAILIIHVLEPQRQEPTSQAQQLDTRRGASTRRLASLRVPYTDLQPACLHPPHLTHHMQARNADAELSGRQGRLGAYSQGALLRVLKALRVRCSRSTRAVSMCAQNTCP
jgi:hypothetical protein